MSYYAVWLKMKDEQLSQEYRPAHLDYLKGLEEQGRLFAYGRFTDGWGGMVIYIGDSYEEVEAFVKQDPYIIHDAREYEIHEWAVIKGKLD